MSEKTGKTTPERDEQPVVREQDRGKFGFPRRADDGLRADRASRLNNMPPVYELIDGRCSYDGLPEGNCAHFPGVQAVIVPGYEGTYSSDELGEDGIPTEEARARWHQDHYGDLSRGDLNRGGFQNAEHGAQARDTRDKTGNDGDHDTPEKPAAFRAKSDTRDTK